MSYLRPVAPTLRRLARQHWLLLLLLVPAVVVRVLATVTYWPALLFWQDSWSYLDAAHASDCCPWKKAIELGVKSDPAVYNSVFKN